MPLILPDQFVALEQAMEDEFLLECVSDWFALRSAIYGRPSRLPFDAAWDAARYVFDRVARHPQPPQQAVEYELIHAVLQAGERGAPPDVLRRGLEAYCRSLPSHEAGMILFDAICDAPEGGRP